MKRLSLFSWQWSKRRVNSAPRAWPKPRNRRRSNPCDKREVEIALQLYTRIQWERNKTDQILLNDCSSVWEDIKKRGEENDRENARVGTEQESCLPANLSVEDVFSWAVYLFPACDLLSPADFGLNVVANHRENLLRFPTRNSSHRTSARRKREREGKSYERKKLLQQQRQEQTAEKRVIDFSCPILRGVKKILLSLSVSSRAYSFKPDLFFTGYVCLEVSCLPSCSLSLLLTSLALSSYFRRLHSSPGRVWIIILFHSSFVPLESIDSLVLSSDIEPSRKREQEKGLKNGVEFLLFPD